MNSAAFQHGHRAHSSQGPVSNQSELWSFDVVQHEDVSTPDGPTEPTEPAEPAA
jgi:hypothetical protein